MVRRLLLTGAGGGGTNNLAESLRRSSLCDTELIGVNMDPYALTKSTLSKNFLLPPSTEEAYIPALRKLVVDQSIDLVIPNNDREVAAISKNRASLNCGVFLPSSDVVARCQDKFAFHQTLTSQGVAMAACIDLKTLDDVPSAIERLPGDRYWVRPKTGSGSKGATWVNNARQARDWIRLWVELRGANVGDFTISEFLPGRDFAVQSVWKDGRPLVVKIVERLTYFGAEQRLSGMSSTPAVACTVHEPAVVDIVRRATAALCQKPHGNFCFDLKCRSDGEPCITECNIGRFCMITPAFDWTGQVNTAEVYVRAAFDDSMQIDDYIDFEPDMYLLRELDTAPLIVDGNSIRQYTNAEAA